MDPVYYGVAIDPESTPVILIPGLKVKWCPFIVTYCVFLLDIFHIKCTVPLDVYVSFLRVNNGMPCLGESGCMCHVPASLSVNEWAFA